METTTDTHGKPEWLRGNALRRSRGRITAGVALALLLPLAGCGGGQSGADEANATTETTSAPSTTVAATTTSAPTSTTEPAGPSPVDSATQDLALAATLQTADFGEGWTEQTPANPDGTTGLTEPTCEAQKKVQSMLGDGAGREGAISELGDGVAFVRSGTYVFPTEQDAEAWASMAQGDPFVACVLEQSQEAYGPDVTMSIESREEPTGDGAGADAFFEAVGRDVDGAVGVALAGMTYRNGRVVVQVSVESGPLADEDASTVSQGASAALAAAYERIDAAD